MEIVSVSSCQQFQASATLSAAARAEEANEFCIVSADGRTPLGRMRVRADQSRHRSSGWRGEISLVSAEWLDRTFFQL